MLKNIKKIIGVLCSVIFCTVIAVGVPQMANAAGVKIDETNFPDKNFRNYVSDNFDTSKDGELSDEEIAGAKKIDIYYNLSDNKEIRNLKGIEYLKALTYLDCAGNQLKSLDVSENTALTYLDCEQTRLTSLDVSKNTVLTFLNCAHNQLTSLDVSKNTALIELWCNSNQLKSLDVSKNTALIELACGENQLTSLNVSWNTALTTLTCNDNQLTNLNVSWNTALTALECRNNQLSQLKLNNQTYNKLSLYKGEIHGDNISLTNLQNVIETEINDVYKVSLIKIIDITKPATYKVDGKDFTIIYVDIEILPSPSPSIAPPSVTPSLAPTTIPSTSPMPMPSIIPSISPSPSPSPAVQSDAHIFNDYNYNSPVTGPAIIYGNGKIQTVDGKKVNNKVFTAYTDILASYKYTLNNNGTVKPSVGKVIVGITKSDTKPAVSNKNKIIDTSASKIAKAKIKNGQITVTAVGKEGGLVYLWVIDTGSKGVSACCPIDVKLAPKKMEVQDKAGTKIAKNTELKNGTSLDVCIAGFVGSTKTNDGTYTATVDSKYQSYVTVTPVQNSTDQFTITAKGLNNNKKTKVTITFKCDQNGKKTKFSLQLIE